MRVVWTQEAEVSFNVIVDYLLFSLTLKEAAAFIDSVENTIEMIVQHPEMFKISTYDTQSREAFINKHTTMFYRILDGYIEIEYFWGNHQNPEKLRTRF